MSQNSEVNSQENARFMTIVRVFSYDSQTKQGIVLGKPFGWESNSAVRLDTHFPLRPVEGHVLRVRGTLERLERQDGEGRPLLSRSGIPLYTLLMRNCEIEEHRAKERMCGKVIRVFSSSEGDERHGASSIALFHPVGFRSPRKVFAPVELKEGEFLECEGMTEKVAAYRYEDGRRKEALLSKDGRPLYRLDFHACEARVRHSMRAYEGEVKKILHPADSHGYCVAKVMVKGFRRTAPTTCYLSLGEGERCEVGDFVRMNGYCLEVPSLNENGMPRLKEDGKPWMNLVIQDVRHEILPGPREEQGDREETSCEDVMFSPAP